MPKEHSGTQHAGSDSVAHSQSCHSSLSPLVSHNRGSSAPLGLAGSSPVLPF